MLDLGICTPCIPLFLQYRPQGYANWATDFQSPLKSMKVIALVMSKLRNEGYMVAPYYQGAIMVTH